MSMSAYLVCILFASCLAIDLLPSQLAFGNFVPETTSEIHQPSRSGSSPSPSRPKINSNSSRGLQSSQRSNVQSRQGIQRGGNGGGSRFGNNGSGTNRIGGSRTNGFGGRPTSPGPTSPGTVRGHSRDIQGPSRRLNQEDESSSSSGTRSRLPRGLIKLAILVIIGICALAGFAFLGFKSN